MFFFFQAEDGIRDKLVTGVQTCALPISCDGHFLSWGLLMHSGASPFPVIVFHGLLFCLQDLLQGIKTLIPELRDVLSPVFKFNHGIWIELIHALLRPFFHHHYMCLTEHFEMLRDSRRTHRKSSGEIGRR